MAANNFLNKTVFTKFTDEEVLEKLMHSIMQWNILQEMAINSFYALTCIYFVIKLFLSKSVFLRPEKQNSRVGRYFALLWYFVTQVFCFSKYRTCMFLNRYTAHKLITSCKSCLSLDEK